MKLRSFAAILTLTLTPLAAQTGAEFYQRAVTAERAGKMPEAIQLYEKVAKDFDSDRPLAAKALVQAARGYERLGQDGALKLYERIARDYADQPDYAQTARAKAAALREPPAPPTMATRKIEFAESIKKSVVFTDGVHAVLLADNTLWTSDITGNNKHAVLQLKPGESIGRFLSAGDLSLVMLNFPERTQPWVMVKADGTGYREFPEMKKVLNDRPVTGLAISWDSRFVVFSDGPRLWKMNLGDGQVAEIRAGERTRRVFAMAISRDGRYLAFGDGSSRFVVPIQGGEPREVNAGQLMGWTRDGRYLASATPAGGGFELALHPMEDGRPSGESIPIKASMPGLLRAPSIVASGSLVLTSPAGSIRSFFAASVASLDEQGRLGPWKQLDLVNNPVPNSLTWTGDGKKIGYISKESPTDSKPVIRLYDLATGQDRELYRVPRSADLFCAGAARTPALFCTNVSMDRQSTDMLRVSTESGLTEKLVTLSGVWQARGTSADDRFVTVVELLRRGVTNSALWEVGTEKPVPTPRGSRTTSSGEWLIRGNTDTGGNPGSVEVRRSSGDDNNWRAVTPLATLADAMYNTPDDKWLLWFQREPGKPLGLYRAPMVGGEPQRIGEYPFRPMSASMRISRDGRQLVAPHTTEAAPAVEYWLLENFVPRVTPTAKAATPRTKATSGK